MTNSDTQTGVGQAPALDQTSQSSVLTVDDLKAIIAQAQAGAADPVTTGMQIFNKLGNNVTASGDVLRQALSASSINAAGGPLSSLLAAAQSIAKVGSQVTVTNTEEIDTEINGTPIKFSPVVSFSVGPDGGSPSINNIQGAAAHKFFWLNITQIQLREEQGKKILHVETSAGARDFPLP